MSHHLFDRGGAGDAAFAVEQRGTQEVHAITGDDGRLLHQSLARVHNDLARAQQLPRDVRRARCRAASALGARIAVEQVLPRQMFDVARTELLDVRFKVHVAHRALHAGTARVREVHVDERRHDVQMLRVWEVVEKDEDQQCVHPPKHLRPNERRVW